MRAPAVEGGSVAALALLDMEIEWANRTNVHWLGLAVALAMAFWLLVAPRRWAPLAFLVLVCFVPSGQRVIVWTLDFSFLRILVLFGVARVLLRGELLRLRPNAIDAVLLAWVLVSLTVYSLRHASLGASVFKLGQTFDTLGTYLLFRCFLASWVDLDRLAFLFTLAAVPVALAFVVESATGRNVFAFLGGVPAITEVRDGRVRCQGAFGHSILAGCFWAAVLPLVAARWWRGGMARSTAVLGTVCALVIVALSNSSTPIAAALLAVAAGFAFYLRRYLAVGRLAFVLGLVALHFVMRAPVWHLIARIDFVGGSTGWHRFYLIDEAIRRFGEWWLLGAASTRHWGLGLGDITNQYVMEAVQGGVLGLLGFVTLAVLGFRAVGRLWRAAWPDRTRVALAWALGVSLFTQCVAFLGVAFFDQTGMLWALVLAALASLSATVPARARAEVRAPARLRPLRTSFS